MMRAKNIAATIGEHLQRELLSLGDDLEFRVRDLDLIAKKLDLLDHKQDAEALRTALAHIRYISSLLTGRSIVARPVEIEVE